VAKRKRSSKTRRKSTKRRKTRRKAPTRRRKAPKRRKVKKKSRPKKRVAGKKGLKGITGNPTLRKILLAAGAVSVATSVAAIVAPQFVPTLQNPLVKAGLGFVTGDIVGAASNFIIGGNLGGNNVSNGTRGFA